MPSDDPRGGPGPALRASDAERDQVAAELGQHYQAGRLDQAEFDERVGAALSARTQRDLTALLADLPRAGTTTAVAARPARWLPLIPLLFAAIVVAGFAAGHGWPGSHHWGGGPWPLLWLIPVALVLIRRRWAGGRGR